MTTLPSAGPPAPIPWALYASLWVVFWILLLTLGVREYLASGGRDMASLAVKYGTAIVLTTVVAVLHARRAWRLQRLTREPRRWFFAFWRWLPVETAAFAGLMLVLPPGLAHVLGIDPFEADDAHWQVYNTAKFVFYNVLLGGVQFAVWSHRVAAHDRRREKAGGDQEARLARLTQQLQPHFVFNGLNTLSSLIPSDPERANRLLERLAALLHAAIHAGAENEQTLDEELALLRAYVDIMAERFDGRAHVDWSIDDDARACLVPTFGLQPVIENCFRHVVERRKAPTRIAIRARREADAVHVEVEDDGDPDTAPSPVRAAGGVGLRNLQQRLESLYGERGRLECERRPHAGWRVRMSVPCGC